MQISSQKPFVMLRKKSLIHTHILNCLLLLSCFGIVASVGLDTSKNWHRPREIFHPVCDVRRDLTTDNQVQAIRVETTATPLGAQFLSFEEWKSQNLAKERHLNVTQHESSLSRKDGDIAASVATSDTSSDISSAATPASTSSESSNSTVLQTDFPEKEVIVPSKKERFNHASFDCAASIIQSNVEAKGASNVLKENKDYYMLNTCSASNRYVIIELCNDILIDSIQIANFEYFSGVFKDVRFSISAKYPPGREGWAELGHFRARNVREVQDFQFENPLLWARFLKLEMLSFYSNEFYCPLSLVRVFGKTMMEDFKQEDLSEDTSETAVEITTPEVDPLSQPIVGIEGVAEDLVALSERLAEEIFEHQGYKTLQQDPVNVEVELISSKDALPTSTDLNQHSKLTSPTASRTIAAPAICTPENILLLLSSCARSDSVSTQMTNTATLSTSLASRTNTSSSTNTTSEPIRASVITTSGHSSETHQAVLDHDSQSVKKASTVRSNTNDIHTSAKIAPQPTPVSQESIYKQITKRLSLLEANATLSLKYIESQSVLLAQSFTHLSSSQARHLSNFLENVNVTIFQRSAQLKEEYSQLYSESVRTIESARRQQEHDMLIVSRRLSSLSDDITYFKRLGIFQTCFMVVLLIFLVTSPGAGIEIQTHLNRALSRRDRTANSSELNTPTTSVKSPRLWGRHFRARSSFNSVYSFPVGQIDRPHYETDLNAQSPILPETPAIGSTDQADTTNAETHDLSSGSSSRVFMPAGLGLPDDRFADSVRTMSVRNSSPLVHRMSGRSKDDMYDGALNSSIRRRLNAEDETTWPGFSTQEQPVLDEQVYAAANYPTPRPESDDEEEYHKLVALKPINPDEYTPRTG